MKRLAILLALVPGIGLAHPVKVPHVHTDDPTLLMGIGAIAIALTLAIVFKRRS